MTERALVTGSSGFLGRLVVRALASSGTPVSGLDLASGDVHTIECDLATSTPELSGTLPGVVYHLAGLAHRVPRGPAEEKRFFDVNLGGTRNLLAGLDRAGQLPAAVVFVSTVAVYGRSAGELLDESTATAAADAYGVSKREAEAVVEAWGRERGVRVGIVRLPLVAGPRAPGNLGAMIAALRRGRYLGVGDGGARRSMVHAADVASILPTVAAVGGVFHLTDGHHPSFLELEIALCRALGRQPPRRLPLPVARLLGTAGDMVVRLGLVAPVTRATIQKMTATLTFSDARARAVLGWGPRRVVDAAGELV